MDSPKGKSAEMDRGHEYKRPVLPESQRFFAKRVRQWVLNPENDPKLTEEIREGKYPELEILLEDYKQ